MRFLSIFITEIRFHSSFVLVCNILMINITSQWGEQLYKFKTKFYYSDNPIVEQNLQKNLLDNLTFS